MADGDDVTSKEIAERRQELIRGNKRGTNFHQMGIAENCDLFY